MTYRLEFHEQALKEWKKLDNSIRLQFKKILGRRLINPHVPSARLPGHDMQHTYWFDGKLARRWGTATAGLRQADSIADMVYGFAIAASLWFSHHEIMAQDVKNLKRALDIRAQKSRSHQDANVYK